MWGGSSGWPFQGVQQLRGPGRVVAAARNWQARPHEDADCLVNRAAACGQDAAQGMRVEHLGAGGDVANGLGRLMGCIRACNANLPTADLGIGVRSTRTGPQQPTLAEDKQIAEAGRNLGIVVGRHHDPANEVGCVDQVLHEPLAGGIEICGGIVEEQHRWIVQQCAGQQQAFALPCRQGVDAAPSEGREADGLEALRDRRGETVPAEPTGGCKSSRHSSTRMVGQAGSPAGT